MNKKKISFLYIFLVIILAIYNSANTFAISNTDFYSANDILFYNPNDGCSTTSSTSNMPSTSSGYDRLKEATRTYGELAMEMEREYGVPWEIVIAQMQKESGVGTAGIAVNGADNNWLGIKGEGDAGSYTGPSGVKWAKYTSVEGSIKDWAGTRVLRNGAYDKAFQYLDPNNYNLEAFLTSMISVYAPDSDGNNGASYVSDVLGFINGPMAEVRAEKGWPSSAELAKKENITIGGKNALGSSVQSTDSSSSSDCSTSAGNGNINKTAIDLAWPDRTHEMTDPKPAYTSALTSVGLNTYPDQYVDIGASCDAFVATVMRYSGVDKDYQCCGTSAQLNYLSHSNKYQEIENLHNTSNLQPGDIFILDGHTFLYIKLDDGSERVASASHGDRTADYAGNVYFSDYRGDYHIFRYKG